MVLKSKNGLFYNFAKKMGCFKRLLSYLEHVTTTFFLSPFIRLKSVTEENDSLVVSVSKRYEKIKRTVRPFPGRWD